MTETTLYKYQAEDVDATCRFGGRVLNANEVGLGKTLESLYYARKHIPESPPGPIVCVVPAHLKLNWRREAMNHLGVRVEVLSGQRVPIGKLPPRDPNQVYVLNYDILVPPNWGRDQPLPPDSWAAYLKAQNPRLVIADEAHYLKSRSAIRTRAVRALARQVPRVLLLTGTPLTNSPADLWSLLNILHPQRFRSHYEFCQEFTHARRVFGHWEFKGARNLKKLHDILTQTCMIRRRKADVLDDLPPIQHTVVPIEVDLTEYRRAETDFLGWLESEAPAMARSAARAEELVRMNVLRQMAGVLKVGPVARWAADLMEETGGKLLLGALNYAVTEPLVAEFGNDAVLVDGRISSEEKDARCELFNYNDRCRVLVGNLQAAGTGWSCRSTSDVGVVQLPWRPADLVQFAGRVHGVARGIEGGRAHIRYFYAEGTIDEDMLEVLQRKAKWADRAVDGYEGETEIDLHSQVLARMRERQGAVA